MLRQFVLISCLVLLAAPAAAQGVQLTPDGERILAQKDVGAERWAVTFNRDDTITGNVFIPGRPPIFVWCQVLDLIGTIDTGSFVMRCAAANACQAGAGCPDWVGLTNLVQLPASFFLP